MAEENDPEILAFQMSDGSDWKLVGWKRVMAWLEELATFWDWMPSTRCADPGNVRGQTTQRYQQLVAKAAELRRQGQPPSAVLGPITQYLQDGFSPVHPKSERGRQLAAIRNQAGDEAALFAFSLLGGTVTPGNMSTVAQLRGATLAVSPEIFALADDTAALKAERSRFRATLKKLAEEEAAAQLDRSREWNAALRSAASAGQGWAAERARRWLRYMHKARERERAAIASIQAVEATYKEHMGLAAPVDYWKTKAKQHADAEFWTRIWVLLFFPVALLGMAYAFNETGVSLIDAAQASRAPGAAPFPNAIFIVASAGLASCAGLVFWVGRLLTKLYLSQHHLRQDAEERATMTETYLALIENSAASTEDRQVILNALFRNTPDGIVKEDGGLDPSIAAALGKFLAKP